jgi:hypothetical protein
VPAVFVTDWINVRGEETSSAQRREFETTLVVNGKSDRQRPTLRNFGVTQLVTNYVEWSGREKKLTLPLFPSYLFRRFKLSDLFAILNSFGVIPVWNAGSNPRKGGMQRRWIAAVPASRNQTAESRRLVPVR